ncbi:hypothetical protein PFISCL1PPCAC_25478, partial [Pristionchus fissidentatus]
TERAHQFTYSCAPMKTSIFLLLLFSIVIHFGNCQIVNEGSAQLDIDQHGLTEGRLFNETNKNDIDGNDKSQGPSDEVFGSSKSDSEVYRESNITLSEANSTLAILEGELKTAEIDFELRREEVNETEKLVELERIELEQVKGIEEESKKEFDAVNRVYMEKLQEWKWHNDKLIQDGKDLNSNLTAVKDAENAYRVAEESYKIKSEELRKLGANQTEFENIRDTALDELKAAEILLKKYQKDQSDLATCNEYNEDKIAAESLTDDLQNKVLLANETKIKNDAVVDILKYNDVITGYIRVGDWGETTVEEALNYGKKKAKA